LEEVGVNQKSSRRERQNNFGMTLALLMSLFVFAEAPVNAQSNRRPARPTPRSATKPTVSAKPVPVTTVESQRAERDGDIATEAALHEKAYRRLYPGGRDEEDLKVQPQLVNPTRKFKPLYAEPVTEGGGEDGNDE
jgi:hypothetical protein